MEGIDLYTAYQNVTNWSAVRAAGKTFAYVKVSDGMSTKPTNGWGPAGSAAGVAMGAYHYAQFGDPVAQADLLISQAIANGLTNLGPALDLEAPFTPGQTAANFAIAFLGRVRDRGFLPVLYGSDSMLSYVAPQVRAAVPQTWIWVARYGANPKTPWNTWQYSDAGSVPGISASAVDLNTGAVPLSGGGGGASPSAPSSNRISPEERMAELKAGNNSAGFACKGAKQAVITSPYAEDLKIHDCVMFGPYGTTGDKTSGRGNAAPDGGFVRDHYDWVINLPADILSLKLWWEIQDPSHAGSIQFVY